MTLDTKISKIKFCPEFFFQLPTQTQVHFQTNYIPFSNIVKQLLQFLVLEMDPDSYKRVQDMMSEMTLSFSDILFLKVVGRILITYFNYNQYDIHYKMENYSAVHFIKYF